MLFLLWCNTNFLNLSFIVVDGYLEFSFELGSGPAIITSTNRVDDGRRHKIVMKREGTEGSLEVDEEEPVSGDSGGMRAALNTHGNIYIGTETKNRKNV